MHTNLSYVTESVSIVVSWLLLTPRVGVNRHDLFSLRNPSGLQTQLTSFAPKSLGWHRLASIAPIHSENPRFRGNRHSIRNPSSQKGTYGQNMGQNRIMGKLCIFAILHLLLLQFQLTYLKNCTDIRNETLHTDRTP